MRLVETRDLTSVYGEGTPFRKVAIEEINLTIESGDYIGLIGHTGSGKSTLVQHFNGLLKPTAGQVLVEGKNLWDKKVNRSRVRFEIGLVFQYPEYQLFEETVYKDIAFGPKNMSLDKDEIHGRVLEAAEFVGLSEEQLNKSPFDLSGGQKRRAAIAGVLAMNPKMLILDEPTAGLDPRGRDRILGQIPQHGGYRQKREAGPAGGPREDHQRRDGGGGVLPDRADPGGRDECPADHTRVFGAPSEVPEGVRQYLYGSRR